MQIGEYQVTTLETGRFALDGGAMFGVVPKVIWQKKHPADELNRIAMALRIVLLRSAERVILIDTGIGNKFSEKQEKMYGIDYSHSTLLGSLQAQGLSPEDVTDVILTHLHFDHAGGATRLREGQLEPTFANARHWVQRENWDWAQAPSEKDRASYLKENFEPLQAKGLLHLLEGPGDILPGIRARISQGHTTGQQLIEIYSESETAIYCADVIPMASHIAVPFVMGYDLRPLQTIAEKKEILQEALAQNWILIFEHDPELVACRVQQGEKGIVAGEPVVF
jgi:glyoxylase-like metal-dependent hydrolase (beta-lactamase superfamily II)